MSKEICGTLNCPMLLILGAVENPTWLHCAPAVTSDCSIRAGYNVDGNSTNKVARSLSEAREPVLVATRVRRGFRVPLSNLRLP